MGEVVRLNDKRKRFLGSHLTCVTCLHGWHAVYENTAEGVLDMPCPKCGSRGQKHERIYVAEPGDREHVTQKLKDIVERDSSEPRVG